MHPGYKLRNISYFAREMTKMCTMHFSPRGKWKLQTQIHKNTLFFYILHLVHRNEKTLCIISNRPLPHYFQKVFFLE